MNPNSIPVVDLELEGILDAREMSFVQKFNAGAELFDYACEITKMGIRNENPHFNDAQVLNELRRRLSIGERLEELGE
jgi:hypothetical protein